MKTILVAVDMSPATVRVCSAAADLAKAIDGRLVIFHAVPPVPSLYYGIDPYTATQLESFGRASRKKAAHQMEALQHWFKKRCPHTQMALHEGPPADNILRTANKVRADYLVLGSHGHGAMYDLLVGSTAHLVIRKSTCPVILVPITAKTGTKKGRQARIAFSPLPLGVD